MKSWQICSALTLGFGILVGGALTQPPARAQGEPAWLPSYDAARAAARQHEKPIFLVFR